MASMAAFHPHGLIRTPIEQMLYLKAHIANATTGIADPKEHETVALMTEILYSNVFTTRENFAIRNEQPPTPTSKSRCDIVVRYLESGSQTIKALALLSASTRVRVNRLVFEGTRGTGLPILQIVY